MGSCKGTDVAIAVYTDDLNHHLQSTGVGCYKGGAWVNSLSYAVDMVLLAPTVTAFHTLLDIVHNTTKTFMLGNEDLSFVEEFRYL